MPFKGMYVVSVLTSKQYNFLVMTGYLGGFKEGGGVFPLSTKLYSAETLQVSHTWKEQGKERLGECP